MPGTTARRRRALEAHQKRQAIIEAELKPPPRSETSGARRAREYRARESCEREASAECHKLNCQRSRCSIQAQLAANDIISPSDIPIQSVEGRDPLLPHHPSNAWATCARPPRGFSSWKRDTFDGNFHSRLEILEDPHFPPGDPFVLLFLPLKVTM